ncbi:MAG: hypothetical protein ABSE73_28475 [Planctomycetota bacterium]
MPFRSQMAYFDACILAPQRPAGEPPPELTGGILCGPDATAQWRVCSAWPLALPSPARREGNGLWLRAAERACVIGSCETRFPVDAAEVVGLRLPDAAGLAALLKRPVSEWWPLPVGGEKRSEKGPFLRLELPPGQSVVAGVRRLVQRLPHITFLLDPFCHGPVPGWQAQVRAAECDNIWLTTLGLLPGAACKWPEPEDVEQAFYFAAGEVGAGRLLLASGRRWEDLLSAPLAAEWLAGARCLDKDQRALILELNARAVFLGEAV